MTVVSLRDLMAQASVDSVLEAKLVASADNLDRLVDVAIAAGYPVTKEDFLSLGELSNEELNSVAGGFTPYDDKNKSILKFISSLKEDVRAL